MMTMLLMTTMMTILILIQFAYPCLQLPLFGSCPDSAQSGFELVCCHELLHIRTRTTHTTHTHKRQTSVQG